MDGMKRSDVLHASGQDCLIAAAVIAASSVAYGSPVRFENDAGYEWKFSVLDLTRSAADQVPGSVDTVTGSSIYMNYQFYSTYGGYPWALTTTKSYTSGNGAEVWNAGSGNRYAAPWAAGQFIGPGMSDGAWGQSSCFAYHLIDTYYFTYNGQMYGTETHTHRGLLPHDGSSVYVGARLTIDNELHYGWIGVTNNGQRIDVFAWGYETEAGVPIAAGAVPAPGALGLLAIGAAGALSGRKRSA